MSGYKKYKKSDNNSYALGITLTFEMLKFKPEKAVRVYIHSQMKENETYKKLLDLCKNTGTEVIHTDKIFHVLTQKENCFCIGEFEKFESAPDAGKDHVVLVNPSNAGNLGTIMRSALGFGFNNIAIIRPAVDCFDPKAVRASMGALFSTNIKYYDSFDEYMEEYGSERKLYPFMLQAEKKLNEINPEEKRFSLIFGNEATGLPEKFLSLGEPLIIPITSKIDSLNLPIAASIAMYQAFVNSGRRRA